MRAPLPNRLALFRAFVRRERLHRLGAALLALFVSSGLSLRVLERSLADWLWWSDVTPQTFLGHATGVVLIFGVGLLGTLTATLAGLVVTQKLPTERGLSTPDLNGHLILCEWNARAEDVLGDLRADPRSQGTAVALIASGALGHGVSNVVAELLGGRSGGDLSKRPRPAELTGRPEVLARFKERGGTLVLAVQRGLRGEVVTNPAADFVPQAGDELVLVGARGRA